MFGDTVKDPSSTRIDIGDYFNAVQNGVPTYGGTSTGSSNTYTLAFSEAPIAKVAGQRFYFIADKTNSGACTLTWGAITDDLKDMTGQLALPANTIRAGDVCEVLYDGTLFRLLSATSITASGWEPFAVALTYISATSFSIPGDWTSILTKGDKLFLSNSGTKYGWITNLSFGAGVTTITFLGGSTYTLASGAITGYYSKDETPCAFPEFVSYTPASYSGFSGTPTTTGRFTLKQRRCFLMAVVSGTSNATSFSFGLPITHATNSGNSTLSWGTGSDNSIYQNNVLSTISSASNSADLNPQGGSANWTNSGTKSANVSVNYPW